MSTEDRPSYILSAEAAAELRVHYQTFCGWLRTGQIPAKKVGRGWRILREDLDAFVGGAVFEAGE